MNDTDNSPLTRAIGILRRGGSLPIKLIADLHGEGHDVTGIIRSIKPDTAA